MRRSAGPPFVVLGFVAVASLAGLTARAQVVRQITNPHHVAGGYQVGLGALDDAGTTVLAAYNEDPFGTNAQRASQLFKWSAAGTATQLTASLEGVSSVSVSDDGQWLAFLSRADLVGQNHDESAELYVMRSDGSQLAQLTNDPAPNAGDVLSAQIAGSANRVVFAANTNPVGGNPQHLIQLFAVNRDGTGLTQLTNLTESSPIADPPQISVSDDGQRFVYTTTAFEGVAISGNGTRIAHVSGDAGLTSSNWDGTGMVQLDTNVSLTVSLNDAGTFVYYAGPDADNFEIFQIKATGGTPRIRLTNTQPPLVNSAPIVAGGGGSIVFTVRGGAYPGFGNSDGGDELMLMDSTGGNLRQLTDSADSTRFYLTDPDLTPDGTRAVFYRWNDNGIYRIQTDGTQMTDLVHLIKPFDPGGLSISSDGSQVAFSTFDDLTGQNPDERQQIFRVGADGSGLLQLTPPSSDYPIHPLIPQNSSFVTFYDPLTVYRVDLDGANVAPMFTDTVFSGYPRVSANGEWYVYTSHLTTGSTTYDQVSRYSVATGVQRLTSDPFQLSRAPDVSADGQRIAYQSTSDPLGTNPDHTWQVFLLEPATGTLRQLTPASSSGLRVRISRDGSWIYFVSRDSVFEDVPGRPDEPYRVNVGTGVIERIGGLRLRGWSPNNYPVQTDASGAHAMFLGAADPVLENPDGDWEVFVVDFTTPPRIRVSAATPTVVSWDVEPAPVRYDVIRGNVANLGVGAGNAVDLGAVSCIENDSPDVDTVGDEDPLTPSSGQAFFYLYRGSQGLLAGPGSYGQGTAGRERVAGAGGCAP